MFEVSTAKKEILERLARQPWTPTDLAEALDKSPNTVYNHLEALYNLGVLTKTQVAAKTRPKTEYNIGEGFIQYLAVFPGQYTEDTLSLTPEKHAIIRIWGIPQEQFHSYIENYWWRIRYGTDIDHRANIHAVAVYGSVANGTADDDSDLNVLVITADTDTALFVRDKFGSLRLDIDNEPIIALTEVYTANEYRNGIEHGSDFLEAIENELHVIYDPDNHLPHPEAQFTNE